MLQCLDQQGHGLLLEVDQDFLQGPFDPDDFSGDGQPQFAQRPGLFFEPLVMALDVPQAHLLQGLFVDQAGRGQAFQVVEGDDVQGCVFGLGQRGGTIEGGAVLHQRRGDQHET